MNISSGNTIEYRRLTTPRVAAIAGNLFGLWFAASLALLLGLEILVGVDLIRSVVLEPTREMKFDVINSNPSIL
jgi:hypothetical protein